MKSTKEPQQKKGIVLCLYQISSNIFEEVTEQLIKHVIILLRSKEVKINIVIYTFVKI